MMTALIILALNTLCGCIAFALMDEHSDGEIKRWFDKCPRPWFKQVVLQAWPVFVYLYWERRS